MQRKHSSMSKKDDEQSLAEKLDSKNSVKFWNSKTLFPERALLKTRPCHYLK